jgi:hypothetical protein
MKDVVVVACPDKVLVIYGQNNYQDMFYKLVGYTIPRKD